MHLRNRNATFISPRLAASVRFSQTCTPEVAIKGLLLAFAAVSVLATILVTWLGYRVRTPGRLPRESAWPDAEPRESWRVMAA